MIRHVVSWNYKESVTPDERVRLNAEFQKSFQLLEKKIPGVLSISVGAPPLKSSTKDLCLYVEMETEEVLQKYASHPEHLKIVEKIVEYCQDRCCLDF